MVAATEAAPQTQKQRRFERCDVRDRPVDNPRDVSGCRDDIILDFLTGRAIAKALHVSEVRFERCDAQDGAVGNSSDVSG